MSDYAEAALAAARESGDSGLVAHALAEVATAQFFTGQPVDSGPRARPWVARGSGGGDLRTRRRVGRAHRRYFQTTVRLLWPALERAIARGREHGEQYEVGTLLFELGLMEWYAETSRSLSAITLRHTTSWATRSWAQATSG